MDDFDFIVVRKRDDQPVEVYPFVLWEDAANFYEKAQAQWTGVYLCEVIESGNRQKERVCNERTGSGES